MIKEGEKRIVTEDMLTSPDYMGRMVTYPRGMLFRITLIDNEAIHVYSNNNGFIGSRRTLIRDQVEANSIPYSKIAYAVIQKTKRT